MTSPVVALRAAIRARLLADAGLVQALGGAKIFDAPPRETASPWIAFGETRLRDWSALDSRGVDATAQIDVWSADPGSRESLDIGERVVALLDDAPLAVQGWRLVRLAFLTLDARIETGGRYRRVALRFRALLDAP